MDTLLSIGIGIALSAACGFRIFVPPLVMSLAAIYGHLPLSPDFTWIGTYPALIAFAVATCIEIAAYYIPWVDHALDIVSTPTAIAAGTFITKALVHDTATPLLEWTIAVIAGGGAAGIIQTFMGMTRLSSTALTGGFGNGIISTVEALGAIVLSALGIFVPFFAASLVVVLLIFMVSKGLQILAARRQLFVQSPQNKL
ncbi:DUF4126 domain-containing protein [Scytonema sp. NUACC26]|uniref:DUF4126 domain-containing protein n=1 Tax=Scytonema sp. NUACC26 TaxID=3140176 RepID=UPI0034DC2A59